MDLSIASIDPAPGLGEVLFKAVSAPRGFQPMPEELVHKSVDRSVALAEKVISAHYLKAHIIRSTQK